MHTSEGDGPFCEECWDGGAIDKRNIERDEALKKLRELTDEYDSCMERDGAHLHVMKDIYAASNKVELERNAAVAEVKRLQKTHQTQRTNQEARTMERK